MSFLLVYLIFNLGKPVIQKSLDLERYHSIKKIILNEKLKKDIKNKDININEIKLENIGLNYTDDINNSLLANINITFKKGDITIIRGDNGSGKTTLLKIIMGILKQTYGEVIYYNNKHEKLNNKKDNILSKISYFSYEQYLNYSSIKKNINYSIYKEKSNNDINNLFDLNIDKQIFYNGKNLSLGEKQKVLLSRCLNKKADVYILDEPTSNLDLKTKKLLLDYILKIKKESIIIIVTHDNDFNEIANNIISLNDY